MRTVAALYDIHGNLPALNAVLSELAALSPDVIVIGGDIALGPMPHQTLERLSQVGWPIHMIRGNTDREVVAAFDGQQLPAKLPEQVGQRIRWVAAQLSSAERDILAGLPMLESLTIDDLGTVLFCHATPHNDEEIFTVLTPDERLRQIFTGVQQDLVVCGHTHGQFERRLGENLRIINAGSVGSPFAEHQPGAYWLSLSQQGYEFRRTEYDVEAAANEIKRSGYPQADEFAEHNVISVPSADETTVRFERWANDQWQRERKA